MVGERRDAELDYKRWWKGNVSWDAAMRSWK
jgi:hypothetical protein